MKKITAIEPQKNHSNRVNVYLDDEFAFGLSKIVAAWLKVGQTLDEAKVAKLQAEESREAAYQQALLFLGYRARSEAEIRKNLEKHDIPAPVVEETLQRLREERLVDDAQFAESWVANRSEFRPRGKRALTVELKRKGLAEAAIQSATEAVDESALAYAAAQKRVRRLEGLEWIEFRKKLGEYLARRGFAYEVVAPTVKRLWLERGGRQDNNFENEEFP
ncbi:MAG: RecX family transcriptional regulator [Chloroflexota bacterium]